MKDKQLQPIRQARKLGGEKSGKARQKLAEIDSQRILELAQNLLDSGRPPHDICGLIVNRGTYKEDKVRRALRKHPSGHWAKKSRTN